MHTHIFSFRKYTLWYQGFLNFADASFFLTKNQRFLAKIVPLLKAIVWELCQRFFSSVFSFCKIKGDYRWKYKFYRLYIRNPASGLLKLVVNWKDGNDVTIFWPGVIVKFSWHYFTSLVNFSYCSKFHVNMTTGSWVMTISFYKGLTRNSGNRKTPVWVLPNIWRLGWVRNTKFGTNICNKTSEVLRENQQGKPTNYPHHCHHPDWG